MLIRPATAVDLMAIARIQQASPEASQWRPEDYLTHECTVAELERSVEGFLVTRQTTPDEREILNLAVAPLARRRGVARALLAYELHGKKGEWFLEVRASNMAALNLYKSLNFQQIAIRQYYYFDPRESAIVMRIFS